MRRVPVIVVLLLFVASAIGAQERVIGPWEVARLRSVQQAKISPDGRSIAYLLEVPRAPFEQDPGAAWGELHVVDTTGNSRPFITGTTNVTDVEWRPGHREISFLSKRTGDAEKTLYVISIEGGEARRVIDHPTEIRGYSWSPDGRRVAFLAKEEQPKLPERRPRDLEPKVYEEQWRPDRVWIADIGTAPVRGRMLELEGSASELHWSPAGDRLAMAIAPTSLIDDRYMRRDIQVVRVDDGAVVGRVDVPGKIGEIAWSPDSRFLAFIGAVDVHDPREGHVMVVPATGGDYVDLTPALAGHAEAVTWRDRDTIVFVASEGVWRTINSIARTGGAARSLAGATGPIWTRISLADGGRSAAAVGSTPQHPGEVFLLTGERWTPRRLTNSNPWLEQYRLAPQEVVTYRASDGLELQGLLIRPLNEKRGARHPLILTIHGGPEAHYSNGWLTSYSLPGQAAASRGYAVFYPNYRGSTGRGVEFSKMSQGDPAGKEFSDFVDAADHLIRIGLADGDKVGITGGSYGGYATAWASTYYTKRFAAGVMSVGISDLIAKVGTSDIPRELYLVHMRKWPWEDWNFMLERSPIRYIEQARTPLLIMHGEEDPRVHPSQSLMLYRYLKILGNVPVRLVFYPREEHGNRRSLARLDYNVRMLRWFDHYLQGPGGAPPPPDLGLKAPEAEKDVPEVDPARRREH